MHRQAHITLVNGVETSALTISDRGLAYGDGLFETMRVIKGKIPLFDFHVARFLLGVKKLQLGKPRTLAADFKRYVAETLSQVRGDAVLKVLVTRGCGGIGYVPPKKSDCNFVVQVFDYPDYNESYYRSGVSVVSCSHRLAHHPELAGIKHLNRLDQVLAAKDLGEHQEGLMFDYQDRLIEGIKSNVLLFEAEKVITPRIKDCGIKGTLREFLLKNRKDLPFEFLEQDVERERLGETKGLAMFNSVFGLWPVASLDGHALPIDPRCKIIQAYCKKHLNYPSR